MGVIIIVLLIIVIFLLVRSSRGSNGPSDFKTMNERLIRMEGEVGKINPAIDRNFRENRKEIAENLERLQTGNEKKLEEMRETVDEKLKASVEKRFNESFKTISTQLDQVSQGLGEMKSMAVEVGGLKKVMEGVKTRGIYGEVQLGVIIEDILNKSQYEENVITKQGSGDRVEFAIKMPGKDDGGAIYLPIDSKFPVENYSRLIAAYDSGKKDEIEKYAKALATDVKEQAKKISTKYLDPPMTTDFGMMFVPTESLYAEILRIPGLSDEIRQKYHVSVMSPSTLPVALNGLLMGLKTVAIEKRSAEVWQTLGAVKTQFGKFGDLLEGVQKKLQESANKIETAKTTSRQIERKLKDVEELPESDSIKLIGEV
ncbi:DNA recombination protein RmuC [Candidatus Saccharibacteria bacterium]|nr:DNA recombination protein RmuC [Candidatus Saccharibacteria bacterium]